MWREPGSGRPTKRERREDRGTQSNHDSINDASTGGPLPSLQITRLFRSPDRTIARGFVIISFCFLFAHDERRYRAGEGPFEVNESPRERAESSKDFAALCANIKIMAEH